MTTPTVTSAADPGLPNETDLAALKAKATAQSAATINRIDQWCRWFGIEHPWLKLDTKEPQIDQLLFDDDLAAWCQQAGIPLDWMFKGDLKSMATAYRFKAIHNPDLSDMHEDAIRLAGLIQALHQLRDSVGPQGGGLSAVIDAAVPVARKLADDIERLL